MLRTMYRTGGPFTEGEELTKTETELQDVYHEKNKAGYDEESYSSMKAVNQTRVQMNLTMRNLRPGREVVPQTGKGQRSRRNLKCTKK